MKRIILYIVMLIILVSVVQWKKSVVTKERKSEKTTLFSVWDEKGVPVSVVDVKKRDVVEPGLFPAEKHGNLRSLSHIDNAIKTKLFRGMQVQSKCKGEILQGTVVGIAKERDYSTGLYPVIINWDKALRCEYLQISFPKNKHVNTVLIPQDTLSLEDGKNFVYKVSNNKVSKLFLDIDKKIKDDFIPKQNIPVGTKLVLEGKNFIEDGSKVKAIASEQ
ncbi:MAG: hypothetical protein ACOCUH_02890 [Bacteriovoracia bacterium]